MISVGFLAERNPFTELIADYLTEFTELKGVIWIDPQRRTLRKRLRRFHGRIERVGLRHAVSEAIWYLVASIIYFPDRSAFGALLSNLRRQWRLLHHGWYSICVDTLNDSEVQQFLRKERPSMLLAQCINEKIPESVYTAPRLGCYVLHEGIVPRYRGKFCTHWAIRESAFDQIGFSLIRVNGKIDGGPVAFTCRVFPDARGHGHGWLMHQVVLLALPHLKAFIIECEKGLPAMTTQETSYPLYSYPTVDHFFGLRRCKLAYERWRSFQGS